MIHLEGILALFGKFSDQQEEFFYLFQLKQRKLKYKTINGLRILKRYRLAQE